MYVSYNNRNIITAAADHRFSIAGETTVKVKDFAGDWNKIIGKRVANGGIAMNVTIKPAKQLRVAVICNWNDKCGISTYSQFLVHAMKSKIGELKIFSEHTQEPTAPDEDFVTRCWNRGENLRPLMTLVREWKPDFIIIQHEFGIYPNATHFFKAMQMIDDIPYVVVQHSVYEHLDKSVYTSVCKNIIVHSQRGKEMLQSKGNTSHIFVIPHGCVQMPDTSELWNIMQNPYTILQFGFGFRYKGVERMLEAVSLLKHSDEKFKNIFYCFLLSQNGHNDKAHIEYYDTLCEKAKELDIEDNVAILRKFNSDEMINLFLREFKLAVFPYVSTPNNTVYGASGAIRIAMASGIPIIASDSHLFDDLEGIVPRPNSVEALAKEIDHAFSNEAYRKELVAKNLAFVNAHTWDAMSDMYLKTYEKIAAL